MRKLLLAISATALMATGAMAADPVMTIEPAYMEPSNGFDWDGFYMGVGVTGSSLTNILTETTVYLDVIAGANMTYGDVLFGLEGWIGSNYESTTSTSGWGGGLAARIGYLVDPSVLIYASGGGYFYDGGAQYGTVGAGIEFAVTDNVSIDVEYKYWGWSNNGWTGHSIGASALWHF